MKTMSTLLNRKRFDNRPMVRSSPTHIVVIGAGAAGLMAARELGRAGKRVTLLEARDRCGGRIDPLSPAQFGYPAEGGAEFVHGVAPVTRSLLREAGISLLSIEGTRRTVMDGKLSTNNSLEIYEANLHTALKELDDDLTVAEFLRRHFAGAEYDRLRRSVERMVEGYDAADPKRASVLALRDEWMDEGRSSQVRVAGGYGRLIDFLVGRCRGHGVAIHLNAVVNAIASAGPGVLISCANGDASLYRQQDDHAVAKRNRVVSANSRRLSIWSAAKIFACLLGIKHWLQKGETIYLCCVVAQG